MKFLSFICVVVVLALNFVPCADVNGTEECQTIVTTAGHQDAPAHTDDCTPFCHCSCCASTVVVKLASSLAIPFKTSTSAYIPHFEGESLDINLPIFQPPKVI